MTNETLNLDFKYKPRDWQKVAQKNLKRFSAILLHRRAGKTVLNVMNSIAHALNCKHKNPVCAYIGPTRDQTKKTAWAYYKDILTPLTRAGYVIFNESDLSIRFTPNNAYIYLLSYENPDSIRGMYLDHVVLDEYQLAPLEMYDTIIRPMLIDRLGSVIFSGTPKGRNQLYQMCERAKSDPDWGYFSANWNETDVIPDSEKIEIRKASLAEAVEQEYMLSFDAAVRGSFFGTHLAKMQAEDRIEDINIDPSFPVVTAWDIGFDGTCIWFLQNIKGKRVIIDCEYYEDEDIAYGAGLLLQKPYVYSLLLLPHDGHDRHVADKTSTAKGVLTDMGFKVKVIKRVPLKVAIHAGRDLLDNCSMTKKLSDKIIKVQNSPITVLGALHLYSTTDKGDTEKHDAFSHIGSAFRNLGVGIKERFLEGKVDTRNNVLHDRPKVVRGINNWNPFK